MADVKSISQIQGRALLNPPQPLVVHAINPNDLKALLLLDKPKDASRKPIRLLCMSYTFSKKRTNAKAQAQTWMHKCDDYFFASDEDVEEDIEIADRSGEISTMKFRSINLHQIGGEKYNNIVNKVRTMCFFAYSKYMLRRQKTQPQYFKYWNTSEVKAEPGTYSGSHWDELSHKNGGMDYDWFYLSGDDNFVLVEHLRNYVGLDPSVSSAHASGTPLYLGRRYSHSNSEVNIFNTGGGGYLLNSHALAKLVSLMAKQETWWCKNHSYASEDVYMGGCLRTANPPIEAYDTRDSTGAERFHPFQPPVLY